MLSKFALIPLGLLAVLGARGTTLSDNLTASTYYTEQIEGSNWLAAGFSTGSGSYKLSSVTALLQVDSPGTLTAALYSNLVAPPSNDLDDEPGTRLGSLGAPTGIGSSLGAITFSGNNLDLAPHTLYWIVMSAPVSGSYEWAYALDNSGSGVGFYPSWGISEDSGSSWYTSALQPMQMRVVGIPTSSTPEPAAAWLMMLGLLPVAVAIVCSRRSGMVESGAATITNFG